MNLPVLRPRVTSQLAVATGTLAFLLPHAHSYWISHNPSFLDRETTLMTTTVILLVSTVALGALSPKPVLRLIAWVMLGVLLGVLVYLVVTTDITGGHAFGAVNPLFFWPLLFVLAFMLTAPVVALSILLGRGLGRVFGGRPTKPAAATGE